MNTILLVILVLAFIYFLRRELKNKFTEKSFLSIVNHTFRTPLTSIKWMSDSLNSTELSIEEQKETTRNISTSIDKILQVVDTLAGIKDVHNRSSYDLKAVSIREIIEQSISRYRVPLNTKKIVLDVPTFADIPLLTVDTKKISFVIDAMLQNAILYTKEGGHIAIDCRANKKTVTLYIADDGIGLSWRDTYFLFDRFYRGRRAKKMNTDGVGLSLYLSKEIIHRHDGTITAKSKGKNKGSTFSIVLPVK